MYSWIHRPEGCPSSSLSARRWISALVFRFGALNASHRVVMEFVLSWWMTDVDLDFGQYSFMQKSPYFTILSKLVRNELTVLIEIVSSGVTQYNSLCSDYINALLRNTDELVEPFLLYIFFYELSPGFGARRRLLVPPSVIMIWSFPSTNLMNECKYMVYQHTIREYNGRNQTVRVQRTSNVEFRIITHSYHLFKSSAEWR